MESSVKAKKSKRTILIVSLLALIGIWNIFDVESDTVEESRLVESYNYNDFNVDIFEPTLTTNADTAKVIVSIPITVTNNSDHGFLFQIPHFFYNENESVFGLFNSNIEGIDVKISRGDKQSGTYTITLDTRDLTEVKTLHPIISIEDMKTEEEQDFKPILNVN
jgi:hypothetical protein